ncbi:MAG: DUF3179 domain-containing protein [Bacteroidetes bacterium]|nr:MAG: DUF3179 domain-containing protein [Bacteroidota bacterium]
MIMRTTVWISIVTMLLNYGCAKETLNNNHEDDNNEYNENNGNNNNDSEWIIPKNEVLDGGPGKDGIPSIQDPKFINVGDATYLQDDDLVLGFANGEEVRAYPHRILDWHEIINDDVNEHSVAVIYCPLTGTGTGWSRILEEGKTTFGVSGLLYNSNVIPYDRKTDSNWSQILLKSVNGQLMGRSAHVYHLVETTWKTWKKAYPSSRVVSTNTGFDWNYDNYPYAYYKTDNTLFFPVSNHDDRLHRKERVLGVIVDEKMIVFRFDSFGNSVSLVNNAFLSKELVVVGSKNLNLMVAFNRELADETILDFEALENELPAVLIDNEGTRWDIFGRGISGPRKGQQLQHETQMMGYWFSFAAFYPDVSIYDFHNQGNGFSN